MLAIGSWKTKNGGQLINNKIKVIKRMAYGFRDDAYFFLKIRAAFPGVG
jgi:transposase